MNEQIIIFTQIVFIDLVLAGDNAIIIGMVASQFPPEQRKKIISSSKKIQASLAASCALLLGIYVLGFWIVTTL